MGLPLPEAVLRVKHKPTPDIEPIVNEVNSSIDSIERLLNFTSNGEVFCAVQLASGAQFTTGVYPVPYDSVTHNGNTDTYSFDTGTHELTVNKLGAYQISIQGGWWNAAGSGNLVVAIWLQRNTGAGWVQVQGCIAEANLRSSAAWSGWCSSHASIVEPVSVVGTRYRAVMQRLIGTAVVQSLGGRGSFIATRLTRE